MSQMHYMCASYHTEVLQECNEATTMAAWQAMIGIPSLPPDNLKPDVEYNLDDLELNLVHNHCFFDGDFHELLFVKTREVVTKGDILKL